MRQYAIIIAMGLGLMLPLADFSTTWAQNPKPATHEVTGTVNDAIGRPISSVAINLQNGQGKTLSKTTSDKQGHFTFKAVAVGTYAMVASKAAFKPGTAIVSVTKTGAKPVQLALQAETALSLTVAAKRLNVSRNALSPQTGG
ncbi:MAG TPA: carboxypeptidase-like regulatory domain-containing protein, partial [Candidatus Binataceae bacterium]|nr:carboxypeptidase-like regulatory domain-containing protein [Candidatus Binataceae bacterium]